MIGPPVQLIGSDKERNTTTSRTNRHLRGAEDASLSYEWAFQTLSEFVIDNWSYIMGHDVCNRSQPAEPPNFEDGNYQLIYQGLKVWKPSEWSSSVALKKEVIGHHPSVDAWNELVLEVPTADSEAVFTNHTAQAVFYLKGNGLVMDEIARRVAKRESKRMGKPMMHIDLKKSNDTSLDLFHCESEEDTSKE